MGITGQATILGLSIFLVVPHGTTQFVVLSFFNCRCYVGVPHQCGCLWRAEEGAQAAGARVLGACELLDVGAEDRIANILNC